MATIQIRDVPEDDYEVLRRAAEREGKSLQAYMREQMTVTASRVQTESTFEAARQALARDKGSGVSSESIVDALDASRGPQPDDDERLPNAE